MCQLAVPITLEETQLSRGMIKIEDIDVFLIHHLFEINDPSGAIQEASKLLLLCGQRDDDKTPYEVAIEARDILNRFIQIHELGL